MHRKRWATYSPYFAKVNVIAAESTIYSYLELLAGKLERALASKCTLELRTLYLAIASDSLSEHAFKKSTGLASDDEAAENWKKTVDMVAAMTPLAKQMPWIYLLATKLPLQWLEQLAPELARVITLKHVSVELRAYRLQWDNRKGVKSSSC